MKKLFLTVFSMLKAVTANAQSVPPITTYPFTLEGDHVVIEAAIDGHVGRFALDTGSAATTLSSALADRLGLKLSELPVSISGAGTAKVPVRVGVANELKIGQLALSNVRVVVLPDKTFKAAGRELDGTVGYDVFAKWTVTIDFENKRLTFFEPASWSPAADAVNVPVDVSRRVPLATVEVRAHKDSTAVTAKVMVDTGTPVFPLTFSSSFAARAGIDQIQPKREVVIGFGTNGISMGEVLRIAEVEFQTLTLRDTFVVVSTDKTGFYASGIADGTIGQAVFQRGTLTVDYAHGRISLQPGKRMGEAWDYPDHVGLALGKDAEGDWSVIQIGVGTPAEEAGLKVGDKLIVLDGKRTAGLSKDQLRAICASDGPLSGTIVRGSERREFKLNRHRLI